MPALSRSTTLAALLLAAAACSDTPPPLAPDPTSLSKGPPGHAASPDRARDQRLARQFAVALNNPVFRAEVLAALQGSHQREGRIHLQRFLLRDQGRALGRKAAAAGVPRNQLRADLSAAPGMEVYLPVPAHRAAWQGGTNVLVATAQADGEVPVAFDLQGRQRLLDPLTPPNEPVIALQAWEGPDGAVCGDQVTRECSGWDDPAWQEPEAPAPPAASSLTGGGLYLTATRFFDTFESWLKGAPEFEVQVLGNKSGTTEMVSYQCVGEQAGGPYLWNQDDLSWTGNVLMFSQAQFDHFNALHPGQGVRLLILEDDDGPCVIKVNRQRATDLFKAVDKAYAAWTSGKQIKITEFQKQFERAVSLYDLISGLASFFRTNDDIVGTAVSDPAAANAVRQGANWIVKNDKNMVTGALRLEMR
jgi:hypothetical protein